MTIATTVDSSTTRTHRFRTVVLAAAALTVAAGITMAGASPAFAHDELLGSSPEPGQVFETPPTEVSLDFSNDVIEVGTAVEVVDHHGGDVAVGDPVVAGPRVTATLPADLEGEYQVRWRAVSSDGHPIEGTIDFGVGADATGVWTEEAAHDESAGEDDHSDEGGNNGDGEHADGTDHAEESAAIGPDGWAVTGFIVGALGILALIAALIVNAKRKSGGPGGGPGASGDTTGNGGDAV